MYGKNKGFYHLHAEQVPQSLRVSLGRLRADRWQDHTGRDRKGREHKRQPKINARRVLAFVGKMAEYGYNLNIAQFFDCSGYVIDGLEHFNLYNGPDIRADDLYNLGESVSIKNAWPGDLVFLGSDTKKTHVGVYASDGVCYEKRT